MKYRAALLLSPCSKSFCHRRLINRSLFYFLCYFILVAARPEETAVHQPSNPVKSTSLPTQKSLHDDPPSILLSPACSTLFLLSPRANYLLHKARMLSPWSRQTDSIPVPGVTSAPTACGHYSLRHKNPTHPPAHGTPDKPHRLRLFLFI